MAELFANGSIVDLIMLFMLVEALALLGWHAIGRRGLAPLDILSLLLPGLALLLALRAALVGAPWTIIAASLLSALALHLLDLWRRTKAAG